MAVIAVVATGDVIRVFAGGRDTVVTGATGANHLGVIYRKSGYPYVRRMAILADISGLHVCKVFAGSLNAIVATHAVVRDICMVKVGRSPANA